MKSNGTRYSPAFKFRVLEALKVKGRGGGGQVARAYGIHPVTLANWKCHFLEHGAEVFGGKEEVKVYEKRLAELERMLGQKEAEIALLRDFCGEAAEVLNG